MAGDRAYRFDVHNLAGETVAAFRLPRAFVQDESAQKLDCIRKQICRATGIAVSAQVLHVDGRILSRLDDACLERLLPAAGPVPLQLVRRPFEPSAGERLLAGVEEGCEGIRRAFEASADPNYRRLCDGASAMQSAAAMSSETAPTLLRELVGSGADVNQASPFGVSPLFEATRRNRISNVRCLLELGALPNAQSDAAAPLLAAARAGHTSLATLLLEKGACVHETEATAPSQSEASSQTSPLHVAAAEGHVVVARLLLEHRASLRSCSPGATPLLLACLNGAADVVECFLAQRADASLEEPAGEGCLPAQLRGFGPLHAAVYAGHGQVVSRLLEARASHDAKACCGATPASLARALARTELWELMLPYGAQQPSPEGKGEPTHREVARAARWLLCAATLGPGGRRPQLKAIRTTGGGLEEFLVPQCLSYIRVHSRGISVTTVRCKHLVTGEKILVQRDGRGLGIDRDGQGGGAREMLRTLRLLRALRTELIHSPIDLYSPGEQPGYVYAIFPYMPTSLHVVIRSRQQLTTEHHQYFVLQVLAALEYLHCAGVVHACVRPSSCLVTASCDLQLTDFESAERLQPFGAVHCENSNDTLSDHVAEQWYRPPERILFCRYNAAVDIWASACLLAELIDRRPLFQGRDTVDQLKRIVEFMDPLTDADKSFLAATEVRSLDKFLVKSKAIRAQAHWSERLSGTCESARDLLKAALAFNPMSRPCATDLMEMDFFKPLAEMDGFVMGELKPSRAPEPFDWFREDPKQLNSKELQEAFLHECWRHQPQNDFQLQQACIRPQHLRTTLTGKLRLAAGL